MFARTAVIKVKPGCELQLPKTLVQEVIPQFRKERDFRGLFAFTFPNGTKAFALSPWDQEESAGRICARGFGVLVALAKVALRTLEVQLYEVSNYTFKTTEKTKDQGHILEAPPDCRVYQSALRPFKVSPARHTWGRIFPLVRGLINSFHR